MNRLEYLVSMDFLTSKKNQKFLPDNTKKEHFGLAFNKYFFHKSGVRFEESFNQTTLKIEISVGIPNKKDFDLFSNLEELIFEFLDKQEVRYD